ncbi:MAG TPA: hypothetical protein VIC24_16845 [Gemmatimonadaceae bacterium]|jgi:hypothetical protein
MHLSFALFSDAANLSVEGKLNILGVFDAVQVAAFPTVHPRAHLVVRLKGTAADAGAHVIALQWVSPTGTELWSSNGELNVVAPPPEVTEIDFPLIAAVDLPLDGAGTYAMRVAIDGAVHGEVRLHVRGAVVPSGTLVS